jgi:hypothetical protein
LLFERPLNEIASVVNEVRDHNWRNVDAVEREKMVRKACGWRNPDSAERCKMQSRIK